MNDDGVQKAQHECNANDDHDGVQKERYESSRVKKPCNAYMMFMKDFMKNKARDFPSPKDAVSAGRLQLMIG